jgi:hypothetical protein
MAGPTFESQGVMDEDGITVRCGSPATCDTNLATCMCLFRLTTDTKPFYFQYKALSCFTIGLDQAPNVHIRFPPLV